jgi:hypothetical protein
MGMISRYFERLTARLQGRRPGPPAVSADAEGLRIGGRSIAWSEVRRLEAYKRDAYVGDCLCLAILGSGDRLFEITEASPGWEEAGDAIERYLPDSMAHAEWMLRLIASEPRQSVAIYPVA